MEAEAFLFVYGTLRKGFAMHEMLDGCFYLADAYINARLYEIDSYPGAIESGDSIDKVYGEIYQVIDQDEVFARLDDYEACSERFSKPHEYIRKQIKLKLMDGSSVWAWVYLYNRDFSQLTRVLSGDYTPRGQKFAEL